MQNKNRNIMTKHRIFFVASLLLLIVPVVFFCSRRAIADDVDTSADVSNQPPVASSVDIDNAASTVHLTENTTTKVTVTATVTDNNGCSDIKSAEAKFYRTDVGASASDDDNNHYTVAAVSDGKCTPGGADLTDTYTATFAVYFNADPTDSGSVHESKNWTAQITPSDSETGTADTDTIEMATLTALNTSGSIAYGSLSLGADTGSTDQTVNVINTGNEGIDVDLDGYGGSDSDGHSMDCTLGSVPVANEKYSASASTAYASKTALSDKATKLDLDIPQRTTTTSSKDTYWGLGMPSQGVGGSCSGTVVFTANSDPNLD